MLDDGSHDIRWAALRALAGLKDLGAAHKIRSLCLTDPHPFVRPEAVEALVALIGEGSIPTLEALANDTNTLVREGAGKNLERLRSGAPGLTAMAGQDLPSGENLQRDTGERSQEKPMGAASPRCAPDPGSIPHLHPAGRR
jgi:HEAT repeat protein